MSRQGTLSRTVTRTSNVLVAALLLFVAGCVFSPSPASAATAISGCWGGIKANAGGGLTPDAQGAANCVTSQHGNAVSSIGGVRQSDGYHGQGRALDVMLKNYESPAGNAAGWTIANWAVQHYKQLGVTEVIFDRKIWTIQRDSEGWRSCGGPAATCYSGNDPSAAHLNHVHLSVSGNAAQPLADGLHPIPAGGGAGGSTGGAAGAPSDELSGSILEQAGKAASTWLLHATSTIVMWVFEKVVTETSPVVNGDRNQGDWFAGRYQMMMNVGWWLMLPLILISVIHSILKGSMQLLVRSFVLYLPLAVLGTIVATEIIQLLIAVVDDMCIIFVNLTRDDLKAFQTGLQQALLYNGWSWILGWLFASAMLVFAFFLLIMFVLRDASIYLAVLFLPIGFAMMVWPMASRYFRKMVEFLVGLILSKLVMVVIISLSVAALAGATNTTTTASQTLFPDGGSQVTAQPGTAGDAAVDESALMASFKGQIERLGFIFPALVMLLLAAISPPLTVKLVGNMGLQEMAGQVADTVNQQAWLYQYIGLERWQRVFLKQPQAMLEAKRKGKRIKNGLKDTSKQELALESNGTYRWKEEDAEAMAEPDIVGTFKITDTMLDKKGFKDEALRQNLKDWTDPENESTNANTINLAREVLRQDASQVASVDTNDGLIKLKDGKAILVMDIENADTHKAIKYHDDRLLRHMVDEEAQSQMAASTDGKTVAGIMVVTPVRTALDERGRPARVNGKHQKNGRKIDNVLRDARRTYATDKIDAVHERPPSAEDYIRRPVDDNQAYAAAQGSRG